MYGALCFHAQQAAEKALKAVLVTQQTEFGRTHDIASLLAASEPAAPGISEALASARALTPYAVETRYPTDEPPITRDEASRALEAARKTVDQARSIVETVGT